MDDEIFLSTSAGRLYAWNPLSDETRFIGATGLTLTDIAFSPEGELYGISFTDLYRVDPETGAATLVGRLSGTSEFGALTLNGANGFDISPVGVARVSSGDRGDVATVELATGAVSNPSGAMLGGSATSAGDIHFIDEDTFLVTTSIGTLVTIQPNVFEAGGDDIFPTGPESVVLSEPLGSGSVFGLTGIPLGLDAPGDAFLLGFVGDDVYFVGDGSFATGTPLATLPIVGEVFGAAMSQVPLSFDGETPPIVAPPGSGGEETPISGATEGPDVLIGTPQSDAIAALGGNDTVKALADDDDIDLGTGDDIALSGGGADTVLGGAGDDTIKSGAGADSIEGGAGNDVILSGNDDDTILGGAGDDTIKPGRGNDSMDGGAGDDILVGFRGDEVLIGGDGNDTLLGNLDDDTIVGGAGDDRLQGGPGRDTFVFDTASWGDDRIVLDFLPQSDTLDFRGSGLTLADLTISAAPGGNVLIEAGDSSILINSARFGPLDVADFVGDVLLFG